MVKKGGFPVDRGWSWMVLAACMLESFIIFGTVKSFGILFVEFMLEYETSAATVSLVLAVKTIVFSISCPFLLSTGLLYIPIRMLIFIGATLQFSGFLLISLVPGVEMLFVSIGVMWGIGECLVHGCILVVLGKYFDKRRGMANTIANTGSSFGGLSLSPLFRFLLDEYRLQGTLLIISGLFLQIFVVCAVLRPESFYISPKTDKKSKASKQRISETLNPSGGANVKRHEYIMKNGDYPDNRGTEDETEMTYIPKDHDNRNNNGQTYSGFTTVKNHIKQKSEDISEKTKPEKGDHSNLSLSINSLVIIGSVKSFDLHLSREEIQKKNITCCGLLKTSLTNLFDKKLLRNKLFILFNVISFLCAYGCGSTIVYIPPFAKDLGIDDSSIAMLVTISASVDIAGRTFLAFFADSKFIKRHQILSIASIITGTSAMFCSFYKNFTSMALFASIFGFFGGMFFCLFPVILIDFIGLENLSNGLGFNLVIHGLSYSVMVPFLGTIRDVTQTYNGSFYLIGAGQILAGCLLLLEPFLRIKNNS